MCKAQQERFEKLSEEVIHMSMMLGDESAAGLAEWKDLESSLTDERLQAFKNKKTELNKATVGCWTIRIPSSRHPVPSQLGRLTANHYFDDWHRLAENTACRRVVETAIDIALSSVQISIRHP